MSNIAPATCGAAMDVPLSDTKEEYKCAPLTFTPGATISGLILLKGTLLVLVIVVEQGPREEKVAIKSFIKLVAPTVKTSGSYEGGAVIELQEGPVFPAETTINTPAALKELIAL